MASAGPRGSFGRFRPAQHLRNVQVEPTIAALVVRPTEPGPGAGGRAAPRGVAMRARCLIAALVLALLPVVVPMPASPAAAAATRPNIFFYNLDDLRDAVPGNIDPMA